MTAMTLFEAASDMLQGTEATGIRWDSDHKELTIFMERGLIVLAEGDDLSQIDVSEKGVISVVR